MIEQRDQPTEVRFERLQGATCVAERPYEQDDGFGHHLGIVVEQQSPSPLITRCGPVTPWTTPGRGERTGGT